MIRIIVYQAVDPVPASLRFVAYPVDDKSGKLEVLPLRFFGETAEATKAEAERLVDSERKKLQRDDGTPKQATPTQLAALEKARAARIAKKQAAGDGAVQAED